MEDIVANGKHCGKCKTVANAWQMENFVANGKHCGTWKTLWQMENTVATGYQHQTEAKTDG